MKSDRVNEPTDGDSLSQFRVTACDVVAAIKKLKPKLSGGADEIPLFIIKGCCGLTAPALAYMEGGDSCAHS